MKKFYLLLTFLIALGNLHSQTIITGRVLGYNKKPLIRADVQVISPVHQRINFSREVNKNGYYSIRIDVKGYYNIQFTGVDHHKTDVPIIINNTKQKIKLNIILKHNRYLKTFKNVQIIGDFNNFDTEHPASMKKQPNGTYTAEFKTNKDRFAYQLVGIEYSGRIINGTDADSYIYDGDGDYESVVQPHDGKVLIKFDPRKLIRENNDGKVTFFSGDQYEQKAYEILTEMQNRKEHYNELLSKHKSKKPLRIDWLPDIAKIQHAYAAEKNPKVSRLLLMSYLQLGVLGASILNDSVVTAAFNKISPTSVLWSIDPKILEMGYGFGKFTGRPGYVNDVIKKNPDREVRAYALYIKTYRARYVGNKKLAQRTLHLILSEYGDTQIGKSIRRAMHNSK